MTRARILAFSIAIAMFLLDRATKMWVEAKVSVYDTAVVIPDVFNIVQTHNRGAAFGMLSTAPDYIRLTVLIGFALVIFSLIGGMLWQATGASAPGSKMNRFALSMVLGGAMGNLYDRIVRGYVTDFLQVFLGSYEWPSFNVADSCIFVGAVLIGIDLIFFSRKQNSSGHVSETH